MLNNCKDERIENLVYSWKDEITNLSNLLKIDNIIIEREIRLHLPFFISKLDSSNLLNIPDQLSLIISNKFLNYNALNKEYLIRSGGENILDIDTCIIDNDICYKKKPIYNIEFLEVDYDTSRFIESNLHYLRSFREDSIVRLGLFIKGYRVPLCYMSFCTNDREYLRDALSFRIGRHIQFDKIIQLSRVYGIGNLPKNSISKLISYCLDQPELHDFHYLTTAINPNLGFTGSSMFASNFIPLTYCPVSYSYSEQGLYTTRRNKIIGNKYFDVYSPSNILMVKGLNRKARQDIDTIRGMYNVSLNDFLNM